MAGGIRNMDDQGPVAEINITPLVDVMLVLLIIFMVTAPMLESGIAIQLPKASAKSLDKGESPVHLSLTSGSKLYLGKDEIPASQLKTRLETFFKGRDRKEIFIRADGTLPYAFVAQTMAVVKQAGIHKIGLVTLPTEAAGSTAEPGP